MKNIKIFLIAGFGLMSCEKVVEVDLNNSDPKLVVEGNILNDKGPFKVNLSRTVNYYEDNTFPKVSGATIVISNSLGFSETLTETQPAEYLTAKLKGIPNVRYDLKVIALGKTFNASSTMPDSVKMDTIFAVKSRTRPGQQSNENKSRYRITATFKDPLQSINFYKVGITSTNSNFKQDRVQVISDKFNNGDEISFSIGGEFNSGDLVTVELQSIDQAAYTYFNTLRNVEGEAQSFLSAPPANPVSNISNGGLGYFAAISSTKKTIVIP